MELRFRADGSATSFHFGGIGPQMVVLSAAQVVYSLVSCSYFADLCVQLSSGVVLLGVEESA